MGYPALDSRQHSTVHTASVFPSIDYLILLESPLPHQYYHDMAVLTRGATWAQNAVCTGSGSKAECAQDALGQLTPPGVVNINMFTGAPTTVRYVIVQQLAHSEINIVDKMLPFAKSTVIPPTVHRCRCLPCRQPSPRPSVSRLTRASPRTRAPTTARSTIQHARVSSQACIFCDAWPTACLCSLATRGLCVAET